jgi:hypothetical protein
MVAGVLPRPGRDDLDGAGDPLEVREDFRGVPPAGLVLVLNDEDVGAAEILVVLGSPLPRTGGIARRDAAGGSQT